MLRRRKTVPSSQEAGPAASTGIDPSNATQPAVPLLGNARAASVADALDRHDVAAAVAVVQQSDNWAERDFLVDVMTRTATRRRTLEQAREQHPTDACVAVAADLATVIDAWEARGGGNSSTVGADQAQRFHDLLRRADANLENTIRLDPSSPIPWRVMLTSGRGLSISTQELTFRFDEAVARCDDLLTAHQQYLQGICAKWGGSTDLMRSFVARFTSTAPVGSPLHSLRVDELIELHWDREVPVAEVAHAEIAPLHEAARKSVLHESMQAIADRPDTLRAFNLFAFAFLELGDRTVADWLFERLAGRYSEHPWTYWNERAVDEVARRRFELLASQPSASP